MSIPNTDIFQYINDGNQYLSFKLPISIHPPPVGPIMITSLARLMPSKVPYPEIEAAHLINITLASLTLVIVYLLLSTLVPHLSAFILTVLLATNQINILYSLDVTNEVIYSFFLTLSLLLYSRFKKSFVYIFFGLLFLIRYESIVVPISIFIIEHYTQKRSLKIKHILSSFIPIVIWLVILNFHSRTGNNLLGNAYFEEIYNGLTKLPNVLSFFSLIDIITFNSSLVTSNLNQIFFLITIALCFYGITNKNSKPILKIIYLIFGLHLLFFCIFPNFAVRYYIPLIWIVYLILANQKSEIISLSILSCLLAYNLAHLDVPSSYYRPYDMDEYRLVADWLNQKQFDKETIVLIYEPYILSYYVTNPHANAIRFKDDFPFGVCKDNIICVSQTLFDQANGNKDVLVVTTTTSSDDLSLVNDKFTPILHHIKTFNDKNISNKKDHFQYLTTLYSTKSRHWANIWSFTPNKKSP